jgi:hypothetical protein
MDVEEMEWVFGFCISLAREGFCGHGNELSGFMKCLGFLK